MRRLSSIAPVLSLACVVGCAGLQIRDRLARARGTPVVEIDRASFDGAHLNGRILISASDAGSVVVDRRLTELNVVVVDSVFDCDGGQTVDYISADAITTPPQPDEYMNIQPGEWFGADFSLFLYDERSSETPPPECIRALLAINFAAAAPGAGRPQLVVQAHLSAHDAGTGEPDGGEQPDAGSSTAGSP